jgi:phosphoglycolate phosphatase
MGRDAITGEQTKAYIGNGIRKYAERALGGGTEEEIDTAVSYFKEYYADHLTDGTYPYGGIAEAVREIKESGVKCAVLSNKYDAATKYIIEYFFPGTFDFVYGEGGECKRKPDPGCFLRMCKKTGCGAEEAVMIGDSPSDLLVAENAGAKHIIVTWGYRTKELMTERGAKVFAETPDDIVKIIKTL